MEDRLRRAVAFPPRRGAAIPAPARRDQSVGDALGFERAVEFRPRRLGRRQWLVWRRRRRLRRFLGRRRIVRRRRGIRLVVMQLANADREKVSAAIAAAESKSNGEIVAVATPISDAYHDVGLHWALVPLFAVLAWAAWRPTALVWWYNFLFGGWQPDPTLGELLTLLMIFAALKFSVALLILKWMPPRPFLTPG